MSRVGDSIQRGLEQAIAYTDGKARTGYRASIPAEIDVKRIRNKLGLT